MHCFQELRHGQTTPNRLGSNFSDAAASLSGQLGLDFIYQSLFLFSRQVILDLSRLLAG